ncbi:hypothetical protein BGZ65_009955, partial [Modicella reniformis]
HTADNASEYPDSFKSDAYKQLQEKRKEVRRARLGLNRKEHGIRELRKELYYYNKLDMANKAPAKNTRGSHTITETKLNWNH